MKRCISPVLVIAVSMLVGCGDDGPDVAARRVLDTGSAQGADSSPPPDPPPGSAMTGSTAPGSAVPGSAASGSGSTAPGSTAPGSAVPEPAAPNGVSVRVQSLDNTFRPEVLEISAGTEVVWTNDGRIDHDVIPSDGSDWGVEADLFAPGDEYRHVFTLPGEYPYFCSIHGTAEFGMIGTVIVTG